MSDPKPAPSLPVDSYRTVISNLIDAWDRLDAYETRIKDIPTSRIVFALTAGAYSAAKAAMHLWAGGFATESMPVVRTCFESGVYAAWTQQTSDRGVEAYLYERARQSRNMLRQFDLVGLPIPDDVREAVLTAPLLGAAPDLKDAARSFQAACEDLRGGEGLYLMYRELSDEAHAASGLIRHLVRGPNNETRLTKRPSSRESASAVAACAVVYSLTWAGRAFAEVSLHKPNKRALQVAARELGIPAILAKV